MFMTISIETTIERIAKNRNGFNNCSKENLLRKSSYCTKNIKDKRTRIIVGAEKTMNIKPIPNCHWAEPPPRKLVLDIIDSKSIQELKRHNAMLDHL